MYRHIRKRAGGAVMNNGSRPGTPTPSESENETNEGNLKSKPDFSAQ